MRHSSRPTNQCKGRSEPITENSSSDQVNLVSIAPPVPTLRPARARRPRPTPRRAADGPRRRRADVPGPVTRRGTGGASRELSHLQVPDAGRGPADRTGGGAHQYARPCPFAALPHDIAADPRLTPTDLRVLAALLFYARQKPICYPSDAAIAARVHRHPGTVRRSLKRLEDIGYIRREFLPPSPANPTGRLIHMTCMEPDWPRPNQTTAPAPTPAHGAHPHPAPRTGGCALCTGGARTAHTEENVIVKKNQTEEEPDGIDRPLRSRPESTPATQPGIDPIPALQAPKLESVVPDRPEPSESILMPQEAPMTLSEPVAGPTLTTAVQALPVADLAAPASRGPTLLPLDLGAIGKPMTSFSMPPRVTTPPVPRPPFHARTWVGPG